MAESYGSPTNSPITWEEWSDFFQLAIIAKKNVDIENLLNPIERHYTHPHALENPTVNELENQRKARPERNKLEQICYDDEEAASIKTETKRFKRLRVEETDKKLRSILYLALGNEGKRYSDRNLQE